MKGTGAAASIILCAAPVDMAETGQRRRTSMEKWSWCLGILILSGVPAIVGGGVLWQFFEKWTPIIIWEVVLLILVCAVMVRGSGQGSSHGV